MDSLKQRAIDDQISAKNHWLNLLHYRKGIGALRSLIDDASFFLAPTGKTDPQAELLATIEALFQAKEGADSVGCRYPARLTWLKEQLDIPDNLFSLSSCEKYQELIRKLEPTSITLSFPGGHLNSPASMFGHTLVNIDGRYQSRLLSYAVNYAAFTEEKNGFVYAFKGIFGGYDGKFSILPYYKKVREYSDMEKRDIWEYKLNLTADETLGLLQHVWELQDIASDYFFLDENCSFNLLFLLDVARPGLQLNAKTSAVVVPLDTIRLIDAAGLIQSRTYRKSKAARMQEIASGMQDTTRKSTADYLDETASLTQTLEKISSSKERIRFLDLAVEDLDSRFLRGKIEPDIYRKEYVTLLQKRSSLGTAASIESQAPLPPERGHQSSLLKLSAGMQKKNSFFELEFRPLYHHLLDPSQGYQEGAQIEFFNLKVRFDRHDATQLRQLTLIDILSLAPRNFPFEALSWKVSTGWKRRWIKGQSSLVYELRPAGGYSYTLGKGFAFVLLENPSQISSRYQSTLVTGLGLFAGLGSNLSENWKFLLTGGYDYLLSSAGRQNFTFDFSQNIRFTENLSMGISVGADGNRQHFSEYLLLSAKTYW